MADIRITISMFGDVQLDREIRAIGRRAVDMDPAFRSIFDHLVDINSENFWSLGARSGHVWKPLKAETIIQKAREGSPTPGIPLRRFGELFDAMSFLPNRNNETIYNQTWAVFRLTGDVADIGQWQQHGVPENNLPARPFFALTELDRHEMVDEMRHYIFRGRVGNFQ